LGLKYKRKREVIAVKRHLSKKLKILTKRRVKYV